MGANRILVLVIVGLLIVPLSNVEAGERSDDAGVVIETRLTSVGSGIEVAVRFDLGAPEGKIVLAGLEAPALDFRCNTASTVTEKHQGTAQIELVLTDVQAGDVCHLIVPMAAVGPGSPAVIMAERRVASVRHQTVARIASNGSSLAAWPEGTYRLTRSSLNDYYEAGGEVGLVEHGSLGSILVESVNNSIPKAVIFREDFGRREIQDGQTNCSPSATFWSVSRVINISDAPSGVVNSLVSVFVQVTHADMSDLQIGFSYGQEEPDSAYSYLWNAGAGSDLDETFEANWLGQDLPGIGQPVNGFYNLALRDCDAGNAGRLETWSLRLVFNETVGLDLVADSLVLPTSPMEPGGELSFTWAGHIDGSGTTGGTFSTSFHLSTDQVLDGGDTLIGIFPESSANEGGETFGGSNVVTLPTGIADGVYRVIMTVDTHDDVDELDETNNSLSEPLTITSQDDQVVDLIADSVSAVPSSVEAGGELEVSWAGHVGGTADVGGAFSVGLYLSSDSTVDTSDLALIRLNDTWGLSPGDSFGQTSQVVQIPANTTAGTYTLGVLLDDGSVIAESDETNNMKSLSITVTRAPEGTVDLVADSVAVGESTVEAGRNIDIDWTGHVEGTTDVGGAFSVGLYLSTDGVVDTSDVALVRRSETWASSPGDSFGQTGQMAQIPANTAAGTYTLGLLLDDSDVISESNETNNRRTLSITVTSAEQETVDLVADSVSVGDSTVEAGDDVTIDWTGHVEGTGEVGAAFSVGIYLSSDGVVNTSDVVLVRRSDTWGSAPGDIFGQNDQSVTIPLSTPEGTYTLGVILDDGTTIAESSEANNTVAAPSITITVSEPDLTLTGCALSPIELAPGGELELMWEAANDGDASSGAFSWSIILAEGPGLEVGAEVLTSGSLGTLAAGATSGSRQSQLTLPADLAEGTYWVGIVLDPTDAIDESNESNNICSQQITVQIEVELAIHWLIPVAASAPGVDDSNWKTQIAIANSTAEERFISLFFVEKNHPWPGFEILELTTVAAGTSLYLDDVLLDLSPITGLVYLMADGPGLAVSSRTYTLDSTGATFGQGIPAVTFAGMTRPGVLVLPLIHSSPGRYRTNLGFVQTSTGSYRLEVELLAADGTLLAAKSYTQAGAHTQINDIFSDMGVGDLEQEGAWLRVRLAGGSPASWTCYASVVDVASGDPTYVAPVDPLAAK